METEQAETYSTKEILGAHTHTHAHLVIYEMPTLHHSQNEQQIPKDDLRAKTETEMAVINQYML